MRHGTTIALFMLPAILVLVLFQYGPSVVAVRNSLYSFSLLNPQKAVFVGLANFQRALGDERFLKYAGNTLIYTAGKIILQIPLATVLALLVRREVRGISIVRAAIFAPTVTAGSTVAVIWNLMYHPEMGIINGVLRWIGLPAQPFLTSVSQALPSILIMTIWQDTGFTMLILLAGLQGIPSELYDAAAVDGARLLDELRYITIPLLRRTLLYAVVVTTISGFMVFTPIYIMTKGGPQGSTGTVVYHAWEAGFRLMEMGYASALAILLIIVMVAVALIQARLLRAGFEY